MPLRPAIGRHPLALAGAAIATVAAAVFCALLIAGLAGLFRHPYAGLVVFVAVPALFVLGLALIPAGLWLERRRQRRDPSAPVDWPVLDFRHASVRRTALIVAALSAVNLVILLVAGYGTLHWMETPSFCGQTCHTPMQPQFRAWEGASHGRVACVSCHIGDGPQGFLHAKLSGVRQLAQVATGSYPRPIPPGAHMRPGEQAETCVSCHVPGHTTGDVIRVVREFTDDEANTETMTTLRMHLGRGSASGRAIHWHADPSTRVEYASTDGGETIPYVRVTDAGGRVKEYRAEGAGSQTVSEASLRRMDCVDCHNTVGHPIAAAPERAVDEAIASGAVSRSLPFVRREAVRLLAAGYPSQDEGAAAIDRGLRAFYDTVGAGVDRAAVDRSASALQAVYRRNVFPDMKVTWGTYPANRGHLTSPGCFRCHDDGHTTSDGSTISGDCEYCHTQLDQ